MYFVYVLVKLLQQLDVFVVVLEVSFCASNGRGLENTTLCLLFLLATTLTSFYL